LGGDRRKLEKVSDARGRALVDDESALGNGNREVVKYFMNDAAFDAPGLTLDRTVHRLGLGERDGEQAILTVNRTAVGEGADVAELVGKNLRQAAVELAGHRVVAERRRETSEGIRTIDVAAEWRGSEGVVYTRQAHLVVNGTWLLFAASGGETTRADCDAAIERAITTFRARR
jgi:hypothetical protein